MESMVALRRYVVRLKQKNVWLVQRAKLLVNSVKTRQTGESMDAQSSGCDVYESGDYYFTKNKYRAVTNIKCDFKTPQTLEGLKAWCDAKPLPGL